MAKNYSNFVKKISKNSFSSFIKKRYPDLPCLIFGKDNNTPMELCETVVENKKVLDKNYQSNYIKYINLFKLRAIYIII